jgi:hypothetical protein
MNFEEALQDITVDDNIKRLFKQRKNEHPRDISCVRLEISLCKTKVRLAVMGKILKDTHKREN